MRAHKKMIALVLALMMTLCWAGLSLAADTKATGQTEMKKETKADTSKTATKADTKKKATKKKATKKKAPSKPININTASEKELQQLAGVGPKTAKAIVDYRKKHGAFKKPEDIMKVSGIGKKTFGKNKSYIKIK